VLVYIKDSLSGDESSAVREYFVNHARFPHESTGDQFFDENQFESYCELGRQVGEQVFAPLMPAHAADAVRMTPEQVRGRILDRMTNRPVPY